MFMCDTLPDVSLYYAYDSVSSAAQFFEIPPPPGAYPSSHFLFFYLKLSIIGAHPACFIDARAADGIQRQTRCISRYLDSAQFMYVRLINSGTL